MQAVQGSNRHHAQASGIQDLSARFAAIKVSTCEIMCMTSRVALSKSFPFAGGIKDGPTNDGSFKMA